MQSFDEYRFKQQVEAALQKVRTILANTRAPQYPADVNHKYDDKYGLAEFLTNTAIAAQINCLELLGANEKNLQTMNNWASNRSVTLRLKSEERCTFDRETTRKVESSSQYVTEYKSASGTSTKTEKVVTTVTEYFWKFEVDYELFAFQGNNIEDKVTLQGRKGKFEIMTTAKSTPKPQVNVVPSMDINVTWLFQHLTREKLQSSFSIDRKKDTCHTPRRNEDVDSAMAHFRKFHGWCFKVNNYFLHQLFPVQTEHGLNLSAITADSIFTPVVPLFEEPKKLLAIEGPKSEESKEEQKTPILPVGDVNQFLSEQKRSLAEKFGELSKAFPDGGKLITVSEAHLLVIVQHSMTLSQHYLDGVDYIESMLHKQIVAAIGKEVSPVDFTNYMKFHNRKLYKMQYQLRPFCYAIRRPDHYPEGILSIEAQLEDGSLAEPIFTSVRSVEPVHPMCFPINAATKVSFTGERFLHAYISHQFEGESGSSLNLVARARQFSSFLLLVGRIVSAVEFEPKYGIIIQNKDDLTIPLLLEQLPTPKEFRDAIESLSPEQQRFCKAFRAMQLASSLFGICVIQIKPQLEKLLKIPYDSLTKEIQLTQDLLELFIKYQIPSDLLSYDGDSNASNSVKIQTVKGYVTAIYDMIKSSKEKELEEVKQEALYANPIPTNNTTAVPRSNTRRRQMMKVGGGGGGGMLKAAKSIAIYVDDTNERVSLTESVAAPKQRHHSPQPSAPSPSAAPVQQEQPKQATLATGEEIELVAFDYTKVPTELDKKFEALDEDSALRPTIINPSNTWKKMAQKALLAEPTTSSLNTDEQKQEKNRAFDLLDALSKSGALSIEYASLHVVLAATHCFDKSLMDTLVQDNINPIEKVERSSLIVATTIQDKPAEELIKVDQRERIGLYSPKLLLTSSSST